MPHRATVEKSVPNFNQRIAIKVTAAVGTMLCAYIFAGVAFSGLLSIFNLLPPIFSTLITWLSQTFIQLVMLSIIMVGQNIASDAQRAKLEQTLKHLEQQEARQLKLEKQIVALQEQIMARLDRLEADCA